MPPAAEEPHGPPVDPRDREIIELRASLAEVSAQLTYARRSADAASEKLILATARATEMEHHLHRRIIEVTELKKRVAELEAVIEPDESRPNPVARRFSPLLARTTLRLHRSDG